MGRPPAETVVASLTAAALLAAAFSLTRFAPFESFVSGLFRPEKGMETEPSLPKDPEACFSGPFPMFFKDYGLDCSHLKKDLETDVVLGEDPLYCSGQKLPRKSSRPFYSGDPKMINRYTTEKYGCRGDCDFNSISNAIYYAEQLLWPLTQDSQGSIGRAPCGGDAGCLQLMSDRAICYVTVTDCRMKPPSYEPEVLRIYVLDCSGTSSCKLEGQYPELCCSPANVPEPSSCEPPEERPSTVTSYL